MSENRCCSGLEKWLEPAIFKALSEPNRTAILAWLAQGGRDPHGSEIGSYDSSDQYNGEHNGLDDPAHGKKLRAYNVLLTCGVSWRGPGR